MKRILTAAVLTVVLLSPTPAEAHTIHCAAYVGNPCYRQAAGHAWLHRLLANPFSVVFGR